MLLRLFLSVAASLLLLPTATSAQVVFVGIPGSRCEFSTALADLNAVESVVDTKKYWASGFLDGAHAALGMPPVRSSINFTYARLQNYCGSHTKATLQEAMLALLREDQSTNTPSASGAPPVIFRPAVYRLDPPTWVLWTYATGSGWEIVGPDSVDLSTKAPTNLSYFETAVECTSVRSWLTGLPKSPGLDALEITFQCFPSTVDPRGQRK